MKKHFLRALALVFCLILTVSPVIAAGGSAALTPAQGNVGESVTMYLSLSGFEDADGLAVTVSGLMPEAGEWVLDGSELDDFQGTSGVWGASTAVSPNGRVLELTFTVPSESTTVTCRVIAKNAGQTVGEATATGKISPLFPAESVTLSASTLALTLDGTASGTLTAPVAPADTTDTVTWSSSDPAVAAVSGGTVTAMKVGTATVTATAGGKSASCTVTVTCNHSSLKETVAKPASCTAAGNNQYFTCNHCATVLAADKTTVTTADQQQIPKKDHNYSWKVDQPATETDTGLKHEECSECGAKRNENTVIDKLVHTHTGITHHKAVAATCTTKGSVEYWTCSGILCIGKCYGDADCQLVLDSILTETDSTNHFGGTVLKKAQKETCGQDGYTGDTHCLGCDAKLSSGMKVAATGKHTYSNDQDATCNVCGHKRQVETKIETTPMYRLYNPNSGEHFYTGSTEERDILINAGWQYEGVAWNAPVYEGYPVYRVYNPNSGDHHYTMSKEEVDMLVGLGWQYENVAWNSATPDNLPLYRLYNPNADCGSHHYTGSTEERDFLVSVGWIFEGIGWFGMLY